MGGPQGAGASRVTDHSVPHPCAQNPRTIQGDLVAAARLPELPRLSEPRVPSIRSLRQVSGKAWFVRLPNAARVEASSDEKVGRSEMVGADEGSGRL